MAKEPKKTSVTDPLESAKIVSKPPASAPRAPPPAPAPVPAAAKPSAGVEPTKPPVKKYRVVETTHISLNGALVKLNKDDVVSEASYGPLGMRRIMESNVALAAIEE